MPARRTQVERYFDALGRADLDGALAELHSDVRIQNRLDQGEWIVGKPAVTVYLTRGLATVRVLSKVLGVSADGDDLMVRVHHDVSSLDGGRWGEGALLYRFSFLDRLIWRIEEIEG